MKNKLFIIISIVLGCVIVFLAYGMTSIQKHDAFPQQVTTIYDHEKNILTKLTPINDEGASIQISSSLLHMIKQFTDDQAVVESIIKEDANSLQKMALNILLQMPFIQKKLYNEYYTQAYMGYGIFGLHTASKTYYDTDVKDLTNEQLLWLLLVEGQYADTGHVHIRNLHADYKKMASTFGLNTQVPTFELVNKADYPFYDVVTGLYSEIQKLSIKEQDLYLQPYDIYLTIDSSIQTTVEQTVNQYNLQDFKTTNAPDVQTAVVMTNHENGEILALYGGVQSHYFDINRAMQLEKPPASTFKPISVYAPALEMGYTAQSILPDQPYNFNGYQPQNYDLAFRRNVTLQEAFSQSYNVPAVWLLNELGLKKGKEYATKFGFEIEERDELRIALGSLVNGVSPVKMAQAYSAFANDGVMNDIHMIQTIVKEKQQMPYKVQSERVITSYTAKQMTELLKSVVSEGTASQLELPFPTVGKTGTMGNPLQTDKSEHIWFIGSTLNMTSAVWIGFDETPLEGGLTVSSGDGAVKLYEAVLQSVYR